MQKDLVTIIVPCYNVGYCINECVDSILAQSYTNFELILIDDGSKDETLLALTKLSHADERIRVISSEHKGVSHARNLGLEDALGRYVTFVDSDDYLEPGCLAKYMEAISYFEETEQTISFLMCGMCVDVYTGTMKEEEIITESDKLFENISLEKIAYLCWKKIFNFITNKCYDLEVIRQYHLRFSEDIQIGEDLLFNVEYLERTEGDIGMINLPMYHYVRRFQESLSLKYYPHAIEHTKYVYKNLLEFVKKVPDTTEDDIAVIKSIYLTDWISRITAYCGESNNRRSLMTKIRRANAEISTEEFQTLLEDAYASGKISRVRYRALKTGKFIGFYQMRRIYRFFKGADKEKENE